MTLPQIVKVLSEDPAYAGRLSYDEILNEIKLDAAAITETASSALLNEILTKYRYAEVGDSVWYAGLELVARKNSVNRVRLYLETVVQQAPVGEELEPVREALQAMGIVPDDPHFNLYRRYLECFLIGAVARCFSPGSKVDGVLVLSGPQGIGKSTFLRTLTLGAAPDGSLFYDNHVTLGSKDSLLALHRAWIVEWAEFEDLIKANSSGRLKAFITVTTDMLRAPYGRKHRDYPRRFALAATTNETVFLNDPSGARRIMAIRLRQAIGHARIQQLRDLLWAWAVQAYRNGVPWHLSQAEAAEQAEVNHEFETEPVEVLLAEVVGERLGAETLRLDATEAIRFYDTARRELGLARNDADYAKAMKILGFSRKMTHKNGLSVRYWTRE